MSKKISLSADASDIDIIRSNRSMAEQRPVTYLIERCNEMSIDNRNAKD
ncbi:hypothetical protein [Sphingobacterium sp. DR205]|nr:hypothetical protein [Sphingobacterium sp. DR205]QIH35456.1 hypothetical protein G6053_22405 [Sphingobacterium sp. DR205]